MNVRVLPSLLATAACAAACLGCAAASGGDGGPDGPRAEIAQAQGDLVVANSKSGQAIFRAEDLAPGDSRSGEVELTNGGRLAGQLALVQAEVRDRPGPAGGLLSDKVLLAIRDVTDPANPATVYSGALGALDGRGLGTITPGENRNYSFTVRLPDGGPPPGPSSGDNAYLGSGLTVRYVWNATAPDEAAPVTPSAAPRLTYRVRSKKLLKRGYIDVLARCNQPCRVSAQARIPRVAKRKTLQRTRRRTVTIANTAKAARIRLKVPKATRRKLKAKLARGRRITLRLSISARATSGGTTLKSIRKVTLRRKRPRR